MFNEQQLKMTKRGLKGMLGHPSTFKLSDEEIEAGTQALNTINALLKGDTISDPWSLDDVQSAANYEYGTKEDGETPELIITPEQGRKVLKMAEEDFDAEQGINWETLGICLNKVLNEKP